MTAKVTMNGEVIGVISSDEIALAIPKLAKGCTGIIAVSLTKDGNPIGVIQYMVEGPKPEDHCVYIDTIGMEGASFRATVKHWES